MKIILKDGKTYSIKRVNKNIITDLTNSEYAGKAPKENAISANISIITLDESTLEIANLFEIENDFREDNIEKIIYSMKDNKEISDNYDVLARVTQNISDYSNEISITLLKYYY